MSADQSTIGNNTLYVISSVGTPSKCLTTPYNPPLPQLGKLPFLPLAIRFWLIYSCSRFSQLMFKPLIVVQFRGQIQWVCIGPIFHRDGVWRLTAFHFCSGFSLNTKLVFISNFSKTGFTWSLKMVRLMKASLPPPRSTIFHPSGVFYPALTLGATSKSQNIQNLIINSSFFSICFW